MRTPTLNPGDGARAVLQDNLAAGPFLITRKEYRHAFSRAPHEHPVCSFDFVLRGVGVTHTADGEVACGPGQLGYFPAFRRQVHSVAAGPVRCLHIAFFPEAAPPQDDCPSHAVQSPRAVGHALRILSAMQHPDASTALHVESLAHELVDMVGPRSRRPPCPDLGRARDMLHATLDTPIGLSELAAATGVSRARLAAAFLQSFGMTAGQYHRRLRLNEAIRLLAAGSEPIAAVAARTGFADQAHLTRLLRAECGLTPAALRRGCQTDN